MALSVAPSSVRTGGTASFTVTASFADPQASTTVNFSMSGKALQGSQYTLSAAQFVIPAGATSANVTLSVLSGTKRPKTAQMTLASGAGYTLSASKTATASISK